MEDFPHNNSTLLKLIYSGVAVFCVLTLFFVPMPWRAKTVASVIVLVALVFAWKQIVFLGNLTRIQCSEGHIALVIGDKKHPVTLIGDIYVSAFLIAFSCRDTMSKNPLQCYSIAILPDAMPAENRRRLRITLKNWCEASQGKK